jgi:hypothetical protein
LDGATVTDVARRNGVSRQTVHAWLRRYASSGIAGLIDKSSLPDHVPHQMPPVIEARVVEMRRAHPGWGPRTIRTHLEMEGVVPPPGRSSIYRALVRHHLIEPTAIGLQALGALTFDGASSLASGVWPPPQSGSPVGRR